MLYGRNMRVWNTETNELTMSAAEEEILYMNNNLAICRTHIQGEREIDF